jgi:hypothetical protein
VATSCAAIADIPLSLESGFVLVASVSCNSDYVFLNILLKGAEKDFLALHKNAI